MLAGLTAGAAVVFGVCCWHFVRGRNVGALPAGGEARADRARAGLGGQPRGRQPLRHPRHRLQPMKIAAPRRSGTRASRARSRSSRSAASRRTTRRRASRSRSRGCCRSSRPALPRRGAGHERAQQDEQYERQNGAEADYVPPVEAIYWSMRGMAYAGSLVLRVHRGRGVPLLAAASSSERAGSCWVGVAGDLLPFVATHVRLGADRARAPAVDRAGAAADEERELARPSARPGSRSAWPSSSFSTSAARRRHLADAPLRRQRPARGGAGGTSVALPAVPAY